MSALEVPPDAGSTPAEITARSGSNFLAGFVCLGAERRHAMTVVYAFCRVVDDAVDEAPDAETGQARLQFWGRELERAVEGSPNTPVGRELQHVMQRFGVPAQALEDLVAGCRTDLDPDGIADEAALELYCYRVAAAVGLACLPILGATGPGPERFAVELGHALQLTNVLRDLRGDAEIGRCYVPRTWLREFGVAREDLAGTGAASLYEPDGGVAAVCRRLAAHARQRFANVRAEQRRLDRGARRRLVAPRIMGAIYRELLHKLERRGGALLLPRERVSGARKMWLLLTVWAGVRS